MDDTKETVEVSVIYYMIIGGIMNGVDIETARIVLNAWLNKEGYAQYVTSINDGVCAFIADCINNGLCTAGDDDLIIGSLDTIIRNGWNSLIELCTATIH